MLRFFKYENGDVEINKEELYLIPSARALVQGDRGGMIHGDHDGRKKLMAKKQLGLVWWIIDINSPGVQNGLEGNELIEDGYRALDIPKEWDYSKDEKFLEFLEVYSEMYNRASYNRLLKEILIAFNDSSETVKAIRKQVKKILKNKVDLDAEDMKTLVTSQNQIIAIASEVPNHIKRLKELQQLVAKEEKETTVARGGITVSSSMVPDN